MTTLTSFLEASIRVAAFRLPVTLASMAFLFLGRARVITATPIIEHRVRVRITATHMIEHID